MALLTWFLIASAGCARMRIVTIESDQGCNVLSVTSI